MVENVDLHAILDLGSSRHRGGEAPRPWTLIAERHATGCSCCPGLGDVTMQEVEGKVVAWLPAEANRCSKTRESVTGLLRDCIARSHSHGAEVFAARSSAISAEALAHLEEVQHGF
jgi:hypothetical protein